LMSVDVIAVDGPSASGKSTVARKVAGRLGRFYVDSGGLYRGVTWRALQRGVDVDEVDAVERLVESIAVEFRVESGAVCWRMDGEDPGDAIRTQAVDASVSPVAAAPGVRARVNAWLRSMVARGPLVVEGRDIATAVFPDACWKFYIDASPEERARRRYVERDGAEGASMAETHAALRRRDTIDSTRKADPLRTAADAVVIDTTALSIDAVVDMICRTVGETWRDETRRS
jgi:cytidylate kinase